MGFNIHRTELVYTTRKNLLVPPPVPTYEATWWYEDDDGQVFSCRINFIGEFLVCPDVNGDGEPREVPVFHHELTVVADELRKLREADRQEL